MEWILYAFLSSLFQACFAETNRVAKLDPWQLNFWHSGMSSLLLALAFPFMLFYRDPLFITAAFLGGTVMVIGSLVQFKLSSTHGGRVSSMFLPVRAFVTFILWCIIFPESFFILLENAFQGFGVLISFIIFVVAMQALRKNDVGWRSFLLVAPIGAMFAISNVIVTLSLEDKDPLQSVLAMTWLIYIISFVQVGCVIIGQKKTDKISIISLKNLKSGFLIALFSVLSFLFLFLGFIHSPNPAYPSVLTMLGPVWIMIYHKAVGIKDDASPVVGLFMIIGAILLVIFTA